MTEYNALVAEFKNLTQEQAESTVTLPVAEDEWDVRPQSVSYGIVSLDFESGSAIGDGLKKDEAFEGSFDLFSPSRDGEGWIQLIRGTLEKHCGSCWSLNMHAYERSTGLFHWEWTFEVTNATAEEGGNDAVQV